MNQQQQRIAIAEACGWVIKTEQVEHTNGYQWTETRKFWVSPHGKRGELPDYLNDLNAIHEAEKTLSWKDEGPATSQRRRYLMNLEAVISGPPNRFGERPNRTLSVPFATAAQRARAFLETLGLWEDDK
jgi:hypothetical protein